MNNFDNEALSSHIGDRASDELQDLFDELWKCILNIINTKLTERQTQAIRMVYLEQKTQTETARILGLCQSSVHKILLGNDDNFRTKLLKKRLMLNNEDDKVKKLKPVKYGGAIKKIKKICETDQEIQSILNKIANLKSDI